MSKSLTGIVQQGLLVLVTGIAALWTVRYAIVVLGWDGVYARDCFKENSTYISASPDGNHVLRIVTSESQVDQEVEAAVYRLISDGPDSFVKLFEFSVTPLQSIQWADNTVFLYGIDDIKNPDELAIERSELKFQVISSRRFPPRRLNVSQLGFWEVPPSCGLLCSLRKLWRGC